MKGRVKCDYQTQLWHCTGAVELDVHLNSDILDIKHV
jgi:hypothetical protein